MKFLWILILLFAANISHAGEKISLDTEIRCEQLDDSDQWIEVGISLNDGPSYSVIVVEHNYDDNSAKLIASKQVHKKSCSGQTCYLDNSETIKLNIYSKDHLKNANFHMLLDGTGSIRLDNMSCYDNKSKISYDKN